MSLKTKLEDSCSKHGAGFGGGLAEYVVLDQAFFYHLPDNVSLEVGALIEVWPLFYFSEAIY